MPKRPSVSRLTDWLQNLNILALQQRVVRHAQRIKQLEERMATNDQLIAKLRVATDNLAAKIRRLSQGDARFEPLIAELEAMGTDPTDPVPDPVEPA